MNDHVIRDLVAAMQNKTTPDEWALLVHSLRGSLTEEVGMGSRLTQSGIPFEAAFVWPDYQARCAVDVNMYADAGGRYRESLQVVDGLCADQPHHPLVDSVRQSLEKSPASFRYGAWLSYRPTKACPKFYAEVATVDDRLLLPDPAAVLQRGIRPVMFGWQQDNGSYEVYYKAAFLRPGDVETLLAFWGMPDRSKEINDLCQRLLRRSLRQRFPFPDIGFSLSFSATGDPQVFTLYTLAQSALGPDHRVREAVLRLGQEEGWRMDQYDCMSRRLSRDPFDFNSRHGTLGFCIPIQGRIQFTIGINPLI